MKKITDVEAILRLNESETNHVKYVGIPEKFWVVTKKDKESILIDIFFESDIPGMIRQAAGGLKWSDVLGIFDTEEAAKKEAKAVLASKSPSVFLMK